MNRPFYAFGVLLALLVLTTLAVSSSSRSTTVRPAPATAKCSMPMQKRPGGAAFVIVLPVECHDRPASKIAAARVELAGQIAPSAAALEPLDCRSHCDAVYDYAVYGELPAIQPQPLAPPRAEHGELEAEELVRIFATLTKSSQNRTLEASAILRGWQPRQLRTMAAGLQHWLVRQANRMPLVWLWKQLLADKVAAAEPLTWKEYAALIDNASGQAHPPRTTTIRLVQDERVQSGHALLHSAASSLNRLALLLELAAQRLEQPKELASTR